MTHDLRNYIVELRRTTAEKERFTRELEIAQGRAREERQEGREQGRNAPRDPFVRLPRVREDEPGPQKKDEADRPALEVFHGSLLAWRFLGTRRRRVGQRWSYAHIWNEK